MANQARETMFRELLDRNLPALRRLAASYAGATSEQADLLQEIALGLWQALPSFRGESSPRTFLFRIAQNRCISHIARRRPTESLDLLGIDPPDSGTTPEQALGSAQDSGRLLAAVRQLPLNHRQVIVLALEDLDYREIAAVLGISESNVGVRMNRARARLRELLGGNP